MARINPSFSKKKDNFDFIILENKKLQTKSTSSTFCFEQLGKV